MYSFLVHAHSGVRWFVLVFLVWAIVNAFLKWSGKKPFQAADKKVTLYALITTHIQLLLGIGLYFTSPKVSFAEGAMKEAITRFFTAEHFVMMLLAVILITIGYSISKRAVSDTKKFRTIWIFMGLGLVLILAGIPWPGGKYGVGWF